MGLIIARWTNSEDDGIYWMPDDAPWKDDGLFQVMGRYLVRGETVEILKYVPDIKTGPISRDELVGVLTAEREAHKEKDNEEGQERLPRYAGRRFN